MPALEASAAGVAGLLQEVFVAEITTAERVCDSCGEEHPIGAHRAYSGAGTVLRCPGCGDVAATVTETPGEVDGAAVRVTVQARNDSSEPQAVDSAVVTVVAADDYGIGTTAGDPSPLSGVVEPGDTVSGVYVFMLDPAADREVTVSVNYAAGEPVAVFTGKTS